MNHYIAFFNLLNNENDENDRQRDKPHWKEKPMLTKIRFMLTKKIYLFTQFIGFNFTNAPCTIFLILYVHTVEIQK